MFSLQLFVDAGQGSAYHGEDDKFKWKIELEVADAVELTTLKAGINVEGIRS